MSYCASVNVSWETPSDTSSIAGYKVYYCLSGETYSDQFCNVIHDPLQSTCTLSGLTEGQIYGFVATSFNSKGLESPFSNEVFYSVPVSEENRDSDNDGLNDLDEKEVYLTDPYQADTDEDGIEDGAEVQYWGINGWDQDYDGDGLINLLDSDSDGDGLSDGDELANNTDPGKKDIVPHAIPQSQMSVAFVDSEELQGEDGAADNVIDGDENTIWHTQWYAANPKHPHEIVLDLGKTYDVQQLSYLPRQDGCENGMIADYQVYVSQDGANWGAPVATGDWTDSLSRKDVPLSTKTGRFVKLLATSEVNRNIWSSAAELNISGTEASAEAGDVILQTGMSVSYADSEEVIGENGSANNILDGDESTIWHTQWYGSSPCHPHEVVIDLGMMYDIQGLSYLPRQDGSENGMIADYEIYVSQDGSSWGSPVKTGSWATSKDEKTVSMSGQTGRYVMLVALSEVNGNAWTSVAEINLTGSEASTPGGDTSPPEVLPKSEMSVISSDSQELIKEDGAADNVLDCDQSTIWHTEWYASQPKPPHEIIIDLGSLYDVHGLNYLPRQDGCENGMIAGYAVYVSLDGSNWGSPVKTGTWEANNEEKTVSFSGKTGRYFKLEAKSEVNGNEWSSAAEIDIVGINTF